MKRPIIWRHWRFLVASVTSVLLFHGAVAQGATISVLSEDDSGPGTLRQAILDALPGDTINFVGLAPTYYAINLFTAELLIDKNLTIEGPRTTYKFPVRNNGFRVFHIAAAVTATISDLGIEGGYAGDIGGGILNEGTLTLKNCGIGGNYSGQIGGGMGNTGTLTINNCVLANNAVYDKGAGLANSGFATITNSTFYENRARNGGAIANTGTLAITNCTISGNTVGVKTINTNYGGGILNSGGGTLTITSSTVSENSLAGLGCGGGIFTEDGANTIARNTIIALNSAPNGPDICGALTSQNFNLIGNNAGATILPAQSSDLIGTPSSPIDPLLDFLNSYGGPTYTQALQPNSPAINSGDPNSPARDQRGYIRRDASDIGAFEFGGTIPVSLVNISTRLRVGTGDNVLIGGFILTGVNPKKILVRAIGPSLSLPGVLANPTLELRTSWGSLIGSNDNWRSDQEAEIMATGIPPSNALESAIVATLTSQDEAYTAIVRGVNNGTGIAVVEAYGLDETNEAKLANISTRGPVEGGNNVLIGGLIVQGQDPLQVIVRAIGPSLPVPGALENPTLQLYDGNGALFASNDNWRTDQEAEIIATGIPPSNDLESAIVQDLAPGSYTAIVRGVTGTTGVAVIEAYALN